MVTVKVARGDLNWVVVAKAHWNPAVGLKVVDSEKGAWELGMEVSEMARLLGRERAG
jgi:hypothetical protein